MGYNGSRKIVYLGLMIGLAMSLQIFESLIPIPTPVPGAKLGLANIITLFVIVRFGCKEAIVITVIRTFLASLFMGTLFAPTFFLSFFGGLVSAVMMGMCRKLFGKHFSLIGISVLGAITHNVIQLLIASLMLDEFGFFYLLPYLLLFGIPTGFFVGIVTTQMLRHRHFKS